MQPSVDEKIYALSCELREAMYSDVDHWTAMQESSEWECSEGTIHNSADACHCEDYKKSL